MDNWDSIADEKSVKGGIRQNPATLFQAVHKRLDILEKKLDAIIKHLSGEEEIGSTSDGKGQPNFGKITEGKFEPPFYEAGGDMATDAYEREFDQEGFNQSIANENS